MPFLILLIAVLSSSPLLAVPICIPQRSQLLAPRKITRYVLKAGQVDDADRKSADDFGTANTMTADAVEKRYAATGDMSCPKATSGQAQLVMNGDTIITSAHIFDFELKCTKITPFSNCRFITKVDGVSKEYKIKRVAGSGHKCPHANNLNTPLKDDWIVLKLEKSVDPKIKPYRVPRDLKETLADNTKVVAVAKSFDWPIGNIKLLKDSPRHYGNCDVRSSDLQANEGTVLTNCDTSPGSSGGSILTPGADPTLVAIVRGSINPADVPGCDPIKYQFNVGAYDAKCWGGVTIPLTEEITKVITGGGPASLRDGTPATQPPVPGFKLPGMHL